MTCLLKARWLPGWKAAERWGHTLPPQAVSCMAVVGGAQRSRTAMQRRMAPPLSGASLRLTAELRRAPRNQYERSKQES